MYRVSLMAALMAALLVGATDPAAAVGPFGPAEVLVQGSSQGNGDASIAPDGTTRGWANCTGASSGRIWFFRDQPNTAAVREPSPYTGVVHAVAWDGLDSTYVVFQYGTQLKIGKRIESSGIYAPATVLSDTAEAATADLVASGGRWWAVWSELSRLNGEGSGGTQLFQRHTLLGVQGRTRITSSAANVYNLEPTLAFTSRGMTMVWTRSTVLPGPGTPTSDDLWLATSTGGAWSSHLFAWLGSQNYLPDITVYGGVTWVTWGRDLTIVVANNSGGTFHSRTFATAGTGPTVAVSGGDVFVAWRADPADRVYVAELSGGSWTGAQIAGAPSYPLRVLAQGAKARVVYQAGTDLLIRTQT